MKSSSPSVVPRDGSGNVYVVNVRKADHIITSIELVEEGKTEEQLIGYRLENWTDVGGLKLALVRQNAGYAGETWTFSNVKITEDIPEELFIKELK